MDTKGNELLIVEAREHTERPGTPNINDGQGYCARCSRNWPCVTTQLADAVVEDLRAVEWIIDAVIAAHGNRISAHYEDCWKYHAGCLAVLLRDRFEEETMTEARQVDEAVVTRVAKAICDEEIACKNTSWEHHGEHTRVDHRKQAKAALEEFLGECHEPSGNPGQLPQEGGA